MITRLKTMEEERCVEKALAYVTKVQKKDIQKMLSSFSLEKIPRHLKRIKSCDGENVFVLIKIAKNHSHNTIEKAAERYFDGKNMLSCYVDEKEQMLEVEVPKYRPETKVQYMESCAIWPCFAIHTHSDSELLNFEYIKEVIGVLAKNNTNYEQYCCGVCIISCEKNILSIKKDSDDVLGHSVLKAVEEVSKSQIGHLCTGLDAFIVNEPCLSCSMSFVHGRIRRVFCVYRKPNNAGSFSGLKINYNKSLNHRYPVYFVDNSYEKLFRKHNTY